MGYVDVGIGRGKRLRWLCCKLRVRTVYCAVRGEDATSSYAAYARLHSTCTSTPSEPGHMHACDAAVHLRARENSPGTRVRDGEQGVRLFFFIFPAYIPCVPCPADDRASIKKIPCPFPPFLFNS